MSAIPSRVLTEVEYRDVDVAVSVLACRLIRVRLGGELAEVHSGSGDQSTPIQHTRNDTGMSLSL